MRRLVYYVGSSTDGRIAAPDGSFDFFALPDDLAAWIMAEVPETVPTHVRQAAGLDAGANRRFDSVLMGRRTYEPALAASVTSPYAHLRQYVVSSTLTVDDPAVTVVDDPVALVRQLKAEPGAGDIWLCGGGRLAGALWDEIDEVIVKYYPVVIGDGVPLIERPYAPAALNVARRQGFDQGVEVVWFEPA